MDVVEQGTRILAKEYTINFSFDVVAESAKEAAEHLQDLIHIHVMRDYSKVKRNSSWWTEEQY